MMIDMVLRHTLTFSFVSSLSYLLLLLLLKHTLFLAFVRTNHEMTWTTSNVARSSPPEEHPSPRGQENDDELTQEQFDELAAHNITLLTQEEFGEGQEGEAGGEGEDDEGSDADDDSSTTYESPEDPFPREPRRKPTADELDKDFDPNEEVGI
jgi:hypothetical protein